MVSARGGCCGTPEMNPVGDGGGLALGPRSQSSSVLLPKEKKINGEINICSLE